MSQPGGPAPVLVDLDSDAASRRDLVGGKGVGLHRLRAGGLPCPPGVVVTTAAYQAFLPAVLRQCGLPAESRQILSTVELAARRDPGLARRLRESHRCAPVPEPLAEALQHLDGTLSEHPHGLAARSSAIAEDGSRRSCAGLYTTRLGVPLADLTAAVRECWSSLWSDNALAGRDGAAHGDPTGQAAREPPAMAVVIQPLVPSTASAVVFTVDPAGGPERPLPVRVEATRGLGAALVSGQVTGDAYLVDRIDLQVLDFQPGDSGGVLTIALVQEVVELSLRAERTFGYPLDVEAAYTPEHGWRLVQARPITTTD
jgi:phosphoenolpyruvate synthase/pyruvate phosphate dikinase